MQVAERLQIFFIHQNLSETLKLQLKMILNLIQDYKHPRVVLWRLLLADLLSCGARRFSFLSHTLPDLINIISFLSDHEMFAHHRSSCRIE